MKVRLPKRPRHIGDLPFDSEGYQHGYVDGARGRKPNPRRSGDIYEASYTVGYEAAKRAIRLDLDPRIETKIVRKRRIRK